MRRLLIGFIALMVLIFLLCVATLCFGAVNIPFSSVVQALFSPGADVSSNILWNLRIPRMIAAILAGASLAVSGLSLQTVFRNPLAGPFVLGISSGASLGVALALLAGIGFGSVGVLGSAALGALLVTLVVMFAATRFAQTGVLLIVGLLTGYFIDSIVSVLIAGNSSESLRVYVAWGMGSFGRVTLGDVWIFVAAVLVGLVMIGVSLRYLNAAKDAERFLRSALTDDNDRLYLRWHDGACAVPGQLDDYAVYALALLGLYRCTFSVDYLEQAALRADQMLTLFADDERGGFYRTASDAEMLISRPKELFDGAMPSGNSCAAMVLQELAELTGEKRFLDAAFAQHAFVAGQAERYGSGVAYGLLAMMRSLFPHRELICCGETDGGALQTYLKQHPANALAILWKTKENALQLDKLAPFTSAYGVPEQGMQWYLCTNGTCDLPVSSFDALRLS